MMGSCGNGAAWLPGSRESASDKFIPGSGNRPSERNVLAAGTSNYLPCAGPRMTLRCLSCDVLLRLLPGACMRGRKIMSLVNHRVAKVAAAAALFLAGVAAGTWHTRSVAAQNRFGQPKTVIHVVVYKWKNTDSEDDKGQALNGTKSLAA